MLTAKKLALFHYATPYDLWLTRISQNHVAIVKSAWYMASTLRRK